MAKDDYYVIAYKLLAYLYSCLKSGVEVDLKVIQHNSDYINIGENYWYYILEHLCKDGYIEGVSIKRAMDDFIYISNMPKIMITPKGIEFLEENSKMQKAKEFLKEIKAMVPFV